MYKRFLASERTVTLPKKMRRSATFLIASISLETDFNVKNSGQFFREIPTDVLSMYINSNVAAVFIPNLGDVILSVDGTATLLA